MSNYYNEFEPAKAHMLRALMEEGLLMLRMIFTLVTFLELGSLKARVGSGMFLPVVNNMKQLQITYVVVGLVAVFMMHVVARRDRADLMFPNIPMQVPPALASAGIIPIGAEGVFLFAPKDKGKRLYGPQDERPGGKHLVDALPAGGESSSDLSQTMPLAVEGVHGVCFGVISMSWHLGVLSALSVAERLADVNQ